MKKIFYPLFIAAMMFVTGCEDVFYDAYNDLTGPVVSVSVTETATVAEGGTVKLHAAVYPAMTNNKNVTWSDDGTGKVTVDQSGLVTGVAEGAATVTVKTVDGEITAVCNVLVRKLVYSVRYNANDGSGSIPSDSTIYKPGNVVIVQGNPGLLVKSGYLFGGWCIDAGGADTTYQVGNTFSITDHNVILYAKWNSYSYTVTFNGQGATVDANPAVKAVASPSLTVDGLPAPPSKTNFSFAGWYSSPGGEGTQFSSGTTVESDLTVYANWVADTGMIIFDPNSGTGQMAPQGPQTGEVTLKLNTYAKLGYTFAGWTQYKDGTGSFYSNGSKYTFGSTVTLYAKWNPDPFTVFYHDNGSYSGSVPAASNYHTGDSVTIKTNSGNLKKIPPSGTAEAYKFGGWNTESDGSGVTYMPGQVVTNFTESVTLYAKWVDYELRDEGPGGGLIFYDKGKGNWNNLPSGIGASWRYMEAAPLSTERTLFWAFKAGYADAPDTIIGKGKENTAKIYAWFYTAPFDPGFNDRAAMYCLSVNNNGYNDWYLPSVDEMQMMYNNLHRGIDTNDEIFTPVGQPLGGFTSAFYWSSTEVTGVSTKAWGEYFNGGNRGYTGHFPKNEGYAVRAARRF